MNYAYTVRNEGNELSGAYALYALQLLMAHEESPADQATPLEILPRLKTFEPRESDTREGTLHIPPASAGVTYTMETSELGTNVDPGLELYAPDGTRLATDRNARIVWTTEVDGAHRLTVLTREWGLDSGYTITLTAD